MELFKSNFNNFNTKKERNANWGYMEYWNENKFVKVQGKSMN